jgi:hypothetical protein
VVAISFDELSDEQEEKPAYCFQHIDQMKGNSNETLTQLLNGEYIQMIGRAVLFGLGNSSGLELLEGKMQQQI